MDNDSSACLKTIASVELFSPCARIVLVLLRREASIPLGLSVVLGGEFLEQFIQRFGVIA